MTVFKSKPVLNLRPFSDVYISTGNGRLKTVLKKGFDALGGIEKVVKPGQSVLLKPNLTGGVDPATGGTTDVRMCEAVAALIKEYCSPGTIYIGENTDTGTVTMDTYRSYGYTDLCERLDIELVDFTTAERAETKVPGALYGEVISIPKLVLDVDVFITLPILKNHDTVCVTGAIKNSFGLVEDATRRQAHRDEAVEQYLVDITRVRKPDFAVVDGRIGMEGIAGGSRFEHPRFANRVIMGADPVAVDVVCAHVMEQNPRVRYLQWAEEFGLGNANLDYINIHGMSLQEAKVPFMTPAGEIEEQTGGKVRLTDLGSCSRCRAAAQGTLHRFRTPESLFKRVEIVYGPGEWTSPDAAAEGCILVGNCIREQYRSAGTWIPGCPFSRDDFIGTLASMDVVCSKCEKTAGRFVADHTPEELAFLRVLASNTMVFQGADNKAGVFDFMLTAGECQGNYARFHIRRGKDELVHMGIADKIDPSFFAVHIPGHDPSLEEFESAFAELKARREKWEEMKASILE